MLGLTGPSVLPTYADLPDLAVALQKSGFSPSETLAVLGQNYQRVFEAVTVHCGKCSRHLASA
jgi:microsomal dipeptidase-like Zn-dependent dipeptidase